MSRISNFKKFLILLVLLSLFVVVNVRAELVNGEDLTDPTRPLDFDRQAISEGLNLGGIASRFNNYKVSSILIRQQLRIAVVNSQRVSIGDEIGNARVTDIDSESVTLDINGESRVIRLYENSIKTLIEGEG